MQQKLRTKLVYLSLAVCMVSTVAFIPSPVFSKQDNSNLIAANVSNDREELVIRIINQQAKEKVAVTVDGNKYYIIVLKNRIDPATLEPQFDPDFTKEVKVYTDLKGAPVSDHDTVKKIQYIDSVRRWSQSRASAASIEEDLQIIDDFTGAMLKVRAYQNALDWIAVGGGTALQLCITGSLNPGAFVTAFTKEIPDELKSTFYDPKNWTAIFGYIIMKQSKSYLRDALVIAERGEICDYDTARQFMNSYIIGWSEFAPAYSLVFESFIQGMWHEDLLNYTVDLAKNILPKFLREEYFGYTDELEDMLDLDPIFRYNQLKDECLSIVGVFLESYNAHADYTLALANTKRSSHQTTQTAPLVKIAVESDNALLETMGGRRVVSPGTTIKLSMSAKNTGNTNWTEDSQYRLGWLSGYEPFPNANAYIRRTLTLGETIPPGEIKTWNITGLITPSKAGTYAITWRMVKEGVEWFGNPVTINIEVRDDSPPPLLPQVNPAIVISPASGQHDAALTPYSPLNSEVPSTFDIIVTGCTPNNEVRVHYLDSVVGSGYTYEWGKTLTTDNQGSAHTTLTWSYKGEWDVWMVDTATGIKSNTVTAIVR